MKLDFPRYTERLGAVSIHAVQRIYELNSGKSGEFAKSHQTIKEFGHEQISNILQNMAIVIPLMEEKLKLLEGVLAGIPNECLVIIVSNSQRSPVDEYTKEVEMVRQLDRFMGKRIVMIHQRDPAVGEILKKLKYTSILNSTANVRAGKAEGMVLGMLIAKIYNKGYVGFIDADNYVPGAVSEYVKIFAVGFGMASSPYCNVRISWCYKPKVKNNVLHFSKWGRVSETTNRYLNSLLSSITGFGTEVIKTGNAGEHALSMPLAESLQYSSGYSVEPYEFIDIFEKFGVTPTKYPSVEEKGVEIFQIESRNPHFHEEKGGVHINDMLESSLAIIAASSICPSDVKNSISKHIVQLTGRKRKKADYHRKYPLIAPISTVPISEFGKGIRDKAETFHRFGKIK